MPDARLLPVALTALAVLGGCGLFVPEKHPLSQDTINPDGTSRYGNIENALVTHIQCEISKGLWEVAQQAQQGHLPHVAWLYATDWGTSVTLTLTFADQSALNPGVSLMTPLENSVKVFRVGGNVTSPQSFSLGLGGSGSANATRTETIQFTYPNKELLNSANIRFARDPQSCEKTNTGVAINSDLKIDQFIHDKATIASEGNVIGKIPRDWPPFNTFQEQITFVASLGGNVTPTWKFARISVDPSGTLLSATRTDTNSLTITLGEVTPATPTSPAQLKSAGQNLHNSGVGGTLTGTQIRSTSPSP